MLLQLHEKLPKNSTSTMLWSLSIWSKLERWKISISGCLMRWPKTKRNHCFKVLFSLMLRNNSEPFLNWIVMCYEKWILYDNQHRPAQWLDREEVPKHFLKPNLHQKRSWSLFGGLLPIGPTIAFWIPASPYVWGVRSANQWDAPKTAMPAASTGQQKGPNSSPWQCLTTRRRTNASKV